MPKNKKPAPRKSAPPAVPDETQAAALCALALELAEQEDGDQFADDLRRKELDLGRQLRRHLERGKDEVLYGALAQAADEDAGAWHLLRAAIEEAAASIAIHRDNAPTLEIDAFAIPLFVRSTGGLVEAEGFQDDAAYDALLESMKSGGLESPKAKLVLVRYAYDAAEASRITYSQLHAMTREAAAALTDKKVAEAPALLRSIGGWEKQMFAAGDEAMELRFLVGFSLKRQDDPFYAVPEGAAQAEAWFEARAERYRQWTDDATPLVQRCLAPAGRALELSFLYQDLFFGARAAGLAEQALLSLMATLRGALDGDGAGTRAVVAIDQAGGEVVLHVRLYRGDEQLTEGELPLDPGSDTEQLVADVQDALATLGIGDVTLAS